MEMIKRFLKEEDGMGTVEIVIIVAVLVAIALLFKDYITNFVSKTLESIFGSKDGDGFKADTSGNMNINMGGNGGK